MQPAASTLNCAHCGAQLSTLQLPCPYCGQMPAATPATSGEMAPVFPGAQPYAGGSWPQPAGQAINLGALVQALGQEGEVVIVDARQGGAAAGTWGQAAFPGSGPWQQPLGGMPRPGLVARRRTPSGCWIGLALFLL